MRIIDLKPGTEINAAYLVVHKRLQPFKDPSKGRYLALQLADSTGKIEARIWDKAEELAEMFAIEDIIQIIGKVEEFNNQHQIVIMSLKLIPEHEIDPANFIPTSHKDLDKLKEQFKSKIETIKEPNLKELFNQLLKNQDLMDNFYKAPAAKLVHHSYLGGLLEHTLEVAEICENLVNLYPELQRDLLITGALLHDIGKIEEFKYKRVIDYSNQGRLLGHTVIGFRIIENITKNIAHFPADLLVGLEHLILSHHGELEYGAPILPQTLEAIALNQADLLSSKLKQAQQIIQNDTDPENQWTNYDRLLGRFLFKG